VPDLGIALPDGHRLVSLAEDPSLRLPMGDHNVAVWPTFMVEGGDAASATNWYRLFEQWPEFQMCLLDPYGRVAAAHNSAPLAWDGTDDGLPDGWDDQFERSAADHDAGRAVNTLGAIQIVVDPRVQGSGLSGTMVQTMRANARAHGLRALIACVRPTLKVRYPLIPIERYATWTRDDGMPFDPWIRLHVRLGGRIVRPSPRSMTYRGTVAEWEAWTGMVFPESGDYVVEGAAGLVSIDRERDEGVYFDPNVWVVHAL
jgi:GNAT superfamily N-acetyltransferase